MSHHDRNDTVRTLQPRWKVVAFLCAYTLLVRLLPFGLSRWGFPLNADISIYPWNFTPLLAVCLFGGALYQTRWIAIGLPVLLMLVGDFGISVVTGRPDMISIPISLSVYAASAACAAFGFTLRKSRTASQLGLAGIGSCLFFYLVTNLVVWLTYDTYSHDAAGLLACYVAGLPFLRNLAIGTVVFGSLLFSPFGMTATASRPVLVRS
jgi:hypothetical protein